MATRTKSGATGKQQNEKYGIEESSLMKLFEDGLKDIYWVEKALIKALPKMTKKATSSELVQALENHLSETEAQAEKVEQVFDIIGKKPSAKKCVAMDGILTEGEKHMKEADEGAMRDAVIIIAGQKVEHYEIAAYGTLRTFADILGISNAATILEEILEQEKAADETLTQIAVSTVNIEAAEEVEADEEEEE